MLLLDYLNWRRVQSREHSDTGVNDFFDFALARRGWNVNQCRNSTEYTKTEEVGAYEHKVVLWHKKGWLQSYDPCTFAEHGLGNVGVAVDYDDLVLFTLKLWKTKRRCHR